MAHRDEPERKPERFSRLVASDEVPLTDEQKRDIESENGLRQYDLMDRLIDEALEEVAKTGRFRLRPWVFTDLNREAVQKIMPTAGSYRSDPIDITGSEHRPPDPRRIAPLLDDMCDVVNQAWTTATPIWLASYVMWRTNWIHPFADGNGRTSRTASYLVLCAALGHRVPGKQTIPEFIAEDKHPYYDALEMCDNAGVNGVLSVTAMEDLLKSLLARQLLSVVDDASSKNNGHTTAPVEESPSPAVADEPPAEP